MLAVINFNPISIPWLTSWYHRVSTLQMPILFVLAFCSSLVLTYQKHYMVRLNYLYQQELKQANKLELEWRELLTEYSVWSSSSRVVHIAKHDYGMFKPTSNIS